MTLGRSRRAVLVVAVLSGGAALVVLGSRPVFPETAASLGAGLDCAVRRSAPSPEAGPSRQDASPEPVPQLPGAPPAPAPDPVTGARAVPIDDPGGKAMRPFYEALAAVERGGGARKLARVSFFGDSHTASDLTTGRLRRLLQDRFGDAGHGFVAAGLPWRSYRHLDLVNGQSGRWEAFRIRHPRGRAPDEADRLVGLSGLAVQSDRPGSAVWVATPPEGPVGTEVGRFELFYLKQPGGGRMRVALDGAVVARLSTRAESPAPAYFELEVPDGPHELRVQTVGGGPVRLFGFTLERDGPGVVLDSLGVNGARVTTLLASDRQLLVDHVTRRSPDLVVLWYGTNEAGDDWYGVDQYGRWVAETLTVVRRAAPAAACLFVGPPDMGRLSLAVRVETLATPDELVRIMDSQREAAERVGCAYWSAYEAMGGRNSIATWAALDPPLAGRDGIHLTRLGYELIGDLLHRALMDGYERHSLAERGE